MIQHVYFIQAAHGPIKIGFTRQLDRRMAVLETASSEPFTLLATLNASRDAEAYLHKKFAAYRMRGEWFKPAQELLDFIEVVKAKGSLAIPEGFEPDPEPTIEVERRRREGIAMICEEYCKLMAGPPIDGESTNEAIKRVAQITGLSDRTIKAFWYSECKDISAYDYLTVSMHFHQHVKEVLAPAAPRLVVLKSNEGKR